MRVAIHHPARTNVEGESVPASVSAYKFGRIDAFVNPLTGETTSKEDVAAVLLAKAKEEHPDCEVVIEHLVHNGDSPPVKVQQEDGTTVEVPDPFGEGGTSQWVHHDKLPESFHSPKGGLVKTAPLTAEQSQEVGS